MKSTAAAVDKVLKEELFPNAQESDGWNFRQRNCYNVKVNELLKKNFSVIEKMYKDKASPIVINMKKKHISLAEAKAYV
jgi:hypothetical protein